MKNYHKIAAGVIFFFVFILCAVRSQAQTQPVYLKGGWYFNTSRMKMVKNKGILIRGGKFFLIGGQPSKANRNDYKVIELDDNEYILPGIVDVHAHYRMEGFGSPKIADVDEFKYNAMVFLANGVTSTWSAGNYYPYLELAAKHLISSGQMPGPHLWASGPYWGTARPGFNTEITKKEIFEQIDYWARLGVDAFKLKRASPRVLKYVIARAHFHGIPTAGHLDSGYRNTTNSIDAIDDGIDRVEHILGGFVLDPDKPAYPVWNKVDTTSIAFQKTIQYFLDHHVYFDATLTAPVYFTTLKPGFEYWYDERSLFTPYVQNMLESPSEHFKYNKLMDGLYHAMLRTTKAFYDAGGGDLLTLGTDAPSHGYYVAGFGDHREMHTMVIAGIPPAAVIKISSQNGANAIGKGSLTGSITTGKLADLYVVRGNPLQDITNTHNVQLVIKTGRIYDPEVLLNKVKGKIGPSDSEEVGTWWKYPMLEKEANIIKKAFPPPPHEIFEPKFRRHYHRH